MSDMICSRQNLIFEVSIVSQFMKNPSRVLWEVFMWVLRFWSGKIFSTNVVFVTYFAIWDNLKKTLDRERDSYDLLF